MSKYDVFNLLLHVENWKDVNRIKNNIFIINKNIYINAFKFIIKNIFYMIKCLNKIIDKIYVWHKSDLYQIRYCKLI